MYEPKLERLTISEILSRDFSEYVLPLIQREYVWDAGDVKEMIESLLNGYPIGIITLIKTDIDLPSIPLIDEESENATEKGITSEKYYILDGQQRLTSLLLLRDGWKIKRLGQPIEITPIFYNPDDNKLRIKGKRPIGYYFSSLIRKGMFKEPPEQYLRGTLEYLKNKGKIEVSREVGKAVFYRTRRKPELKRRSKMEINFSKLGIFQRYEPEIVKVNLRSKYPPLYTFIRFWGRLPDYLLDDLIGLFRDKNKNILFDPFGGSGSVIFKGMSAGFSKIIYNDINPAFTFITSAILRGLRIPRDSLEEHINKLKQQLLSSSIILDLSRINEKTPFIYKIAYNQQIILNKEEEEIDLGLKKRELNEVAKAIIRVLKHKRVITFSSLREKTFEYLKDYNKLVSRVLFSFVLNKLVQKGVIRKETKRDYFILSSSITFPRDIKILKIDENLDKKFEKKEKEHKQVIKESVFSYALEYQDGRRYRKAEGAKTIGDLYSTWSKILLSLIWEKIEEFPVQNSNITDVLKVCFLASLYDSSLMQMPHKSGWIIKSFWIPSPCGTKNPLYVFIKKLNHFLSVYDSLQNQWNEQTRVLIFNKDIFAFTGRELKGKPDLVITHPPYFSTVQYGELSAIWSSWLNYKIPFEKEIIQNQQQGKNKDVYLFLLGKSLEKISSLSRKNADIILIFQSKNQRDWELLDKVLLKAPLELKQIRCYQRNSWWGSKHIFNVGDFDYALIFRNKG